MTTDWRATNVEPRNCAGDAWRNTFGNTVATAMKVECNAPSVGSRQLHYDDAHIQIAAKRQCVSFALESTWIPTIATWSRSSYLQSNRQLRKAHGKTVRLGATSSGQNGTPGMEHDGNPRCETNGEKKDGNTQTLRTVLKIDLRHGNLLRVC